MTHLFISYVREDSETVERLCSALRNRGIRLWLDRDQILPGQRWQQAVRQAIKKGAFFVACFSKNYFDRDTSYMNEELTVAVEELRKRPTERTWFIPVLLDKCLPPDRSIGGGETFRSIEWVALYEDWEREMERLLKSIRFENGFKADTAIEKKTSSHLRTNHQCPVCQKFLASNASWCPQCGARFGNDGPPPTAEYKVILDQKQAILDQREMDRRMTAEEERRQEHNSVGGYVVSLLLALFVTVWPGIIFVAILTWSFSYLGVPEIVTGVGAFATVLVVSFLVMRSERYLK